MEILIIFSAGIALAAGVVAVAALVYDAFIFVFRKGDR